MANKVNSAIVRVGHRSVLVRYTDQGVRKFLTPSNNHITHIPQQILQVNINHVNNRNVDASGIAIPV